MPVTSKQATRREFLNRLRSAPVPQSSVPDRAIRPPWVHHFDDQCTACGDCAPACPEGIIGFDHNHFPIVDFSKGECTFCAACVDACPEDVFDTTQEPVWQLDIAVGNTCFAEKGIYCRSCGDSCPESAIRIPPQLGGRARVIIDEEACTKCGACLSACPADAISITPQKEHSHE
ncbi:ferredoxin-type protein NapF [Paremcibacter congregatus]|uniref:ferredoxin-type protein NapF n=1 Tax=Paremcibacter congregatus TaxID=2043170 RepID=UPI003A8D78C8